MDVIPHEVFSMSLFFNCESCGAEIAVKFLSIGEEAKCKACDAVNVVPADARDHSSDARENEITNSKPPPDISG